MEKKQLWYGSIGINCVCIGYKGDYGSEPYILLKPDTENVANNKFQAPNGFFMEGDETIEESLQRNIFENYGISIVADSAKLISMEYGSNIIGSNSNIIIMNYCYVFTGLKELLEAGDAGEGDWIPLSAIDVNSILYEQLDVICQAIIYERNEANKLLCILEHNRDTELHKTLDKRYHVLCGVANRFHVAKCERDC